MFHLLANAAEHVLVLKEVLVVRSVSHRGKELDGVGHEQVILCASAGGEKQVPHL